MKDIFKPKSNDKIRPLDITVNKHRKSLTALNQKKKGNQLPTAIQSKTFILRFKKYIKIWFGSKCKCNACLTIT